jgi:RNA polymerase sigma-70 factor (ECF subfamily)
VAKDDLSTMRRVAAGDQDAFRLVFERHSPAVLRFLISRVGPHHAEDLLTETFMAAWSSSPKFAASDARPWLLGIAANKIRNHRELECRWQRSILSESARHSVVASEAEQVGLPAHLAAALAQLPVGEREIVLLVAIGDMSATDAAQSLGISPIAARMRLHRARRSLARAISKGES